MAISTFFYAGAVLGADALAVAMAGAGAFWFMPAADLLRLAGITLFLLGTEAGYLAGLPEMCESQRLARGTTLALVLVVALTASEGRAGVMEAVGVGVSWVQLLWLLPLLRRAVRRKLASVRLFRRRVLLMGDVGQARLALEAIAREPQLGWELVGCLSGGLDSRETTVVDSAGNELRILGGLEEAPQAVSRLGIQEIVLLAGAMPPQQQATTVQQLQLLVEAVHVMPYPCDVCTHVVDLNLLLSNGTTVIRPGGLYQYGYAAMKRTVDLICSLLLLPLILPLMAVAAVAVKIDSPGPAFFKDSRLKRSGRPFILYKFRTMHVNGAAILERYLSDHPEVQTEWDRFRKLRGYDPRVTRVGRFLRKWSLDELPQILNVLGGEMSLVGPRPYRTSELPTMGPYGEAILSAMPGITGLWQVMGRSEVPFDQRLLLEAWYARNGSFWLDLVLLVRTAGIVVLRKGAY